VFLLISAAFTTGNHMFPALGATDRGAGDKVGRNMIIVIFDRLNRARSEKAG
jgi:hypothetical protein